VGIVTPHQTIDTATIFEKYVDTNIPTTAIENQSLLTLLVFFSAA
jgi:hypothetical protein